MDLDTILFDEEKDILGKIDDVLGNIQDPHYTITIDGYIKNKLNSNKTDEIKSLISNFKSKFNFINRKKSIKIISRRIKNKKKRKQSLKRQIYTKKLTIQRQCT